MLFNSLAFAIFFPLVVWIFFSIPKRMQWVLLLFASYVFYAWWKLDYLALIWLSTGIDYVAGIQMGKAGSRRKRRPWLILSLATNLGLLVGFKYFNFFSTSLSALLGVADVPYSPLMLNVVLPVGISFYTFQTLAYSIDVYRGKQQPEHHLGKFALYVSFFPQLVAGPIERSQHLLPQFHKAQTFDYQRAVDGLKLMLWGFFKKLVIADRLAVYVDQVYAAPAEYSGLHLLLATYFFAFQIYCDFSGYSDIAIGSAQVMGYDLMDNFRRPYFSRSISEFWRRWHISLSSWFKDYLYIPLGGNRVAPWRWRLNLFVVFVVSGLWHGAAWPFVLWGALHGFYLIFESVTQKHRDALWSRWSWASADSPPDEQELIPGSAHHPVRKWVSLFVTFHMVVFAWIFFRAESVGDLTVIISRIASPETWSLEKLTLSLGRFDFLVAIVAIGFMEVVHIVESRADMRHFLSNRPRWVRWTVYYAIALAIVFFGVFQRQEFIYFQF